MNIQHGISTGRCTLPAVCWAPFGMHFPKYDALVMLQCYHCFISWNISGSVVTVRSSWRSRRKLVGAKCVHLNQRAVGLERMHQR